MNDTNDQDVQPQINRQQHDAIVRVERILMAPCCYTQTIDVHNSDIAETMRAEVLSMTLAGKGEKEIFGYYKSIYGERVLAIPDGALGQLAFAIPITVTAFATGALLVVLRRFHTRKVSVSSIASGAAFEISETVREEIRRQTAW